ncbi:MAG TPA: DUF58 domain-containing protein [Gaiellaceae bacterium]|nr:DUF58 domain-containing protein [Gaiellaceae bacterium]
MTRFGGALVLGLVVTVSALAFGSRPLGVAGLGLLFAAGAARVWRGAVRERVAVVQAADPSPAVEGARVRLDVEVRRVSRMPVAAATVHGSLGRLGGYECRLRGHGRTLTGTVDLGRLPRGRFRVSEARLELGDVLGLETVSLPIDGTAAVLVYPRLVELETLFSEAGRRGGDGRRLLLRRTAGFDFHSVREYEQGESLRRVHWPTTARRGQLMVKELDDAPRDAVVVLLDCDPSGAVGLPPDSSFDTAVRAAASILRVYAARGRRATLVATGIGGVVDVCSLTDFGDALDALAAVEPDAAFPLARALGHEQAPAARAGELVVVTATLDPTSLGAVLDSAARRLVSVVWVDAPSFAGRPTRALPGLLRLSAAGVPVAVLRRGDDLSAALDAARPEVAAHG